MADPARPCQFDVEWLGDWWDWGSKPSGVACDEPSDATITFACVHEHVDAPRACSGCALDAQKAAGGLTCPRCWLSPERHDCYGLVVIDWDSGEKTIVQEATGA